MAETTLSMTRTSLIGRIFWEVFPQTVGTRLERYLRRAAEERAPFTSNTSMSHGSAGLRTAFTRHATAVSRYSIGYYGTKNADRALRESEDRFRTLADNISQFAWTADANGSLTWFDRRWFDYTGMTTEQAMGWGWVVAHHPDHVDQISKITIRHQNGTHGKNLPATGPTNSAGSRSAVPIKDQAGMLPVGSARTLISRSEFRPTRLSSASRSWLPLAVWRRRLRTKSTIRWQSPSISFTSPNNVRKMPSSFAILRERNASCSALVAWPSDAQLLSGR